MDTQTLLITNIRNFKNSAELVYNSKDYTSSTILYFKSLFAVLDLILLKTLGKTPKDHAERFRMLQKSYPALYLILDKLYPKYREAYTLIISKNDCDKIRENVERIIKEQKVL